MLMSQKGFKNTAQVSRSPALDDEGLTNSGVSFWPALSCSLTHLSYPVAHNVEAVPSVTRLMMDK
jgi:hypothetical protein